MSHFLHKICFIFLRKIKKGKIIVEKKVSRNRFASARIRSGEAGGVKNAENESFLNTEIR